MPGARLHAPHGASCPRRTPLAPVLTPIHYRLPHTSPRLSGGASPGLDTDKAHRARLRCPCRARALAAALVLFAAVFLAGYSAWSTWRRWLTPVWGVVIRPEWVVVKGTQPVAVVTLAVPDVRHAGFMAVSLQEKAQYATARGYWFIACNITLDAGRPPVWSKLRLVAAVLEQVCFGGAVCALNPGCLPMSNTLAASQVAPTVLWLDLDTIVWTRHLGVEALQATSPGADLHAQHDFHRFRTYFNAGVLLFRSSDWTKWLLVQAYNTRRTMALRRVGYTMEEQDALNIAARLSQARPEGTRGVADGFKVKVHSYPRMWAFYHDGLEADGRFAEGILALHFPNCRDGTCQEAYSKHVALALAMPTDKAPNADADAARAAAVPPGEPLPVYTTRQYGADMPLRTRWFTHDRR